MGKHAIGLQHLYLLLIPALRPIQHLIHPLAQLPNRPAKARALRMGVIRNRIADNHARLVQPDAALGTALLRGCNREHQGQLVRGWGCGLAAGKRAQLCHLCQNHGHDFQGIDFVWGIIARLARLHHQHT